MKKRNFVLTGRRDKKKRKKPEGQRLSFDASRDQRVPSWTDANFRACALSPPLVGTAGGNAPSRRSRGTDLGLTLVDLQGME